MTKTKNFLFRLSEHEHAELRAVAAEAGLTMQAYIEMRTLGRLRPRGPYGPRPWTKPANQKELPLTG